MICDYCSLPPELCECHGEPRDFTMAGGYYPEFPTTVRRSFGAMEEVEHWDFVEIEVSRPKYPILHQGVYWNTKETGRVLIKNMGYRHLERTRDMLVKKFGESVKESPLVKALEVQLRGSRSKASNIQKAKI